MTKVTYYFVIRSQALASDSSSSAPPPIFSKLSKSVLISKLLNHTMSFFFGLGLVWHFQATVQQLPVSEVKTQIVVCVERLTLLYVCVCVCVLSARGGIMLLL